MTEFRDMDELSPVYSRLSSELSLELKSSMYPESSDEFIPALLSASDPVLDEDCEL
jgi:hypothetical protein